MTEPEVDISAPSTPFFRFGVDPTLPSSSAGLLLVLPDLVVGVVRESLTPAAAAVEEAASEEVNFLYNTIESTPRVQSSIFSLHEKLYYIYIALKPLQFLDTKHPYPLLIE